MAVDIQKVADNRVNGPNLWEIRGHRHTNFKGWKDRLETVDALYRGDWQVVFPNETKKVDLPHVMNLVQVEMDDIARLVSETDPAIRCHPESGGKEAQRDAYIREAIAETYWDVNAGDLLVPMLAMDLAGAGACFLVVHPFEKGGQPGMYPRFHRVDPRMAYPDVFNGELQDLLVVQVIPLRQAARLFPLLGLGEVSPDRATHAEVLEYYSAGMCQQAIGLHKDGSAVMYSTDEPVKVVKTWEPDIGVPPVAFAQLDSFDGQFRGMFDQVAGSLRTKNRIVKLVLDYADRQVYAPKVSKGLLNPEERDGPNAHFRLDPNIVDAQMGRLAPAGSAPQLFALLEFLDREQRGGTGYPQSRQGQVSQAIASGTFVASTQGQLTTIVRNIQRLLGMFREQVNEISFQLDEKHLDKDKPLTRAVGKKRLYLPSRDISGVYQNRVIYGAGAGLDRLNADVRIERHMATGLISKETAREQLDYIDEKNEEQDKIEREMGRQAMVQKFFAEAPWDVLAEVNTLTDKGTDIAEAITSVTQKRQAAQPESEQPEPQALRGGQERQGFEGPPLAELIGG